MAPNHTCNDCKFETSKLYNYNKHLKTQKHILTSVGKPKKPKKPSKIICEYCDKQISYKRHLKRHYMICKKKNIIEEPKDYQIKILQLKCATLKEQVADIEEKYQTLLLKMSIRNIINNNQYKLL